MRPPIIARVDRARIAGRWVTDALVELGDTGMRLVPDGEAAGRARDRARIRATLVPPITDAHVHLGLADVAAAGPTTLGRVLDLGWAPQALPGLIDAATAAHRGLDVRVAGPFHAALGGYPSDRAWAPPGSVVELPDSGEAARSVRERAHAGASVVKVTLNADAGPVPDDALLAAIADATHALGLLLVAHVQGQGQALRALDAGVDVLAHAPWTERLDDETIARAAASQTWISTLAMHDRDGDRAALERASDNLARFADAGGAVAYGTDLGNGLRRLDLDPSEIAALRQAGIEGTALVDALLAESLLPPGPTLTSCSSDVRDDASLVAALIGPPRDRPRPLPRTWFDLEDA
ncbi:hydrolase [Agrococcus sp. 1P02AA]|uniref:hydrolase n=1 Tax=Agrococcus sp. 1P02AA TaxID=3132259 RepID=UPI0039A682EF